MQESFAEISGAEEQKGSGRASVAKCLNANTQALGPSPTLMESVKRSAAPLGR